MKALFNLVHVDVDSISTYRDAGLSAQTPPRNDVFIDHRSPFATAVVYGLEMGFSPKLNPVPQGWT